MKARIKKTGEVIDFLGSSIEYGTCTWIDSKGDFNQGPAPGIEILETGKPIDWEQRRYEIAKESICAIMSNEEFYAQVLYEGAELNGRRGIPCNVSHAAVVFADALIAELKKESAESQNIQKTQEKEIQIGDIIEVDGEKYLCKEAHEDQDCSCCDLCIDDDCKRPYGNCSSDYRKDGKDLLFKKI